MSVWGWQRESGCATFSYARHANTKARTMGEAVSKVLLHNEVDLKHGIKACTKMHCGSDAGCKMLPSSKNNANVDVNVEIYKYSHTAA